MNKYPLSSIRQTLIDWKYRKKYSFELKTYDIHEKITGEQEILFKNKIKIENTGGTFEFRSEPVKFLTTAQDNTTYTKAQESERNTVQHKRFFEK